MMMFAAARLALLEYKNDDQLCEQFATLVGKDTRKKFPAEGTMALAEVLLCSDSEQWRSAALDYLELAILPSRQGFAHAFRPGGGAQCKRWNRRADALGKSAVFDKSFPLRRVMVQMLAESRKPEAVGALIELLPRMRGEVRADVMKYLIGITGQRLGADQEAWDRWWKANQATFAFPTEISKAPLQQQAGSQARYYGLPIYGERLVFVIDTSGSMEGGKLEAAKRELIEALFGLPDESYFSLITFSSGVNVWQSEMAAATLANKTRPGVRDGAAPRWSNGFVSGVAHCLAVQDGGHLFFVGRGSDERTYCRASGHS